MMKKNNSMLTNVFFACICVLFVNISAFSQTPPYQNDYALGLDLSFVKQAEDRGVKYYDEDGTEKPVLQIFRQHGYNWSRIMICNEPTNRLPHDLAYVVDISSDALAIYYNGNYIGGDTSLDAWGGSLGNLTCTLLHRGINTTQGWVGYLAHAAIWQSVLTPTEIETLAWDYNDT